MPWGQRLGNTALKVWSCVLQKKVTLQSTLSERLYTNAHQLLRIFGASNFILQICATSFWSVTWRVFTSVAQNSKSSAMNTLEHRTFWSLYLQEKSFWLWSFLPVASDSVFLFSRTVVNKCKKKHVNSDSLSYDLCKTTTK